MTKFAIIAANRIKPEPLKGKHFSIDDRFKREDIRSAVEWLKSEIVPKPEHLSWDKCVCRGCVGIRHRIAIIDKAFEDVMK